ncbi:DUF413 domain-containing protein [Pseudoalteromonas tunicata]|uniref:DUF413 domain-containing protein n=1 Tax=Pseudoalteromonas tunicata TaxID=314281 RepID=UPI00273F4FD9|nr:DUF413 domain-containing protein [Pseudoalteromonas tunicata]MDP5212824.1 DUF413 domain-containing protein [Pseudoalteromonas tunicata]
MSNQDITALKHAFTSDKLFYDDANFPRGFSRSGNFTLLEAEILENYGAILQALHKKTVQPSNDLQTQFVKTLQGEQEPSNVFEKAWLKYLKLTTNAARFHTVFGKSKSTGSEISYGRQIEEF